MDTLKKCQRVGCGHAYAAHNTGGVNVECRVFACQCGAFVGNVEPRTLDNTSIADAKATIPDIKVVGDGDLWGLLGKASSASQGWMKSTKAMAVPGGVVVQVTTQQRNPDGSWAVAEAITYVPQVDLMRHHNDGVDPGVAPCYLAPRRVEGIVDQLARRVLQLLKWLPE